MEKLEEGQNCGFRYPGPVWAPSALVVKDRKGFFCPGDSHCGHQRQQLWTRIDKEKALTKTNLVTRCGSTTCRSSSPLYSVLVLVLVGEGAVLRPRLKHKMLASKV